MFPNSISTHINILSGSDIKVEDSAFDNIRAFLKSQFNTIRMEPGWIVEDLGYLVPHATDIFIWTTTAIEFLQVNSQQLSMFQSKGNRKKLESLYSLYSTVIKTPFGCDIEEEEIKMVTSVVDTMFFQEATQ